MSTDVKQVNKDAAVVRPGKRKQMTGVVVSDRMNKTRIVRVERTTRHPVYEKTIKKHRKFFAHDEANSSKTGDKVLVAETRALSKNKFWRIVNILREQEKH